MTYHPHCRRLRRPIAVLVVATLCLLPSGIALAIPTGSDFSQKTAQLCHQAVTEAERRHRIPAQLLTAVSIVESGRWSKAKQANIAWPWTVYAEGRGRYLKSKAAAVAMVERLKARGVRNIDVGCMQVNLKYHPKAFRNLGQALEPRSNVAYAARLLADLKHETRSWSAAVGRYHSRTPKFNGPYRRKVQATWRGERRRAARERRNKVQARWQRRFQAKKLALYQRRMARRPRLYVKR